MTFTFIEQILALMFNFTWKWVHRWKDSGKVGKKIIRPTKGFA